MGAHNAVDHPFVRYDFFSTYWHRPSFYWIFFRSCKFNVLRLFTRGRFEPLCYMGAHIVVDPPFAQYDFFSTSWLDPLSIGSFFVRVNLIF